MGSMRISRQRQMGPSALSLDGRNMLRAIRDGVNAQGEYHGSNADAAQLAGVPVEHAARALAELATRGFLKLRRTHPAERR